MKKILETSDKPNILVIGDLMIDHYLWGTCERISPEAPVPIIDIKNESTVLGGAGNVINNLLSLGSEVGVLSVVGDDDVADELRYLIDATQAKSYLVLQKGRSTSKKSKIMADKSQVARYDHESKNNISFDSANKLYAKLQQIINAYDIILLSDYEKGVLTKSLTKDIISFANKLNKKVIVDPKGKDYSKYKGAYFLTPNKKEAEIATGIKIEDNDTLKEALETLKINSKLEYAMITLGDKGIAVLDGKEVTIKETVAREVYNAIGAGDTVISSLGYSLSLGADIYTAMEFANLAAGVAVSKLGNSSVSLADIEEYQTSLHKGSIDLHIKTKKEIKKISKRLREQNKKVVFTNGCFDILHKGHVSYLNKAKSFGDVLILGLNSDLSVKRLKGENRPINNQEDRAYLLCALESVDYVVIFEEDTPYELISKIKPDVLVKGSDYEGKEIAGSDIVKETKLVSFVDGKSTTSMIDKILNSNK